MRSYYAKQTKQNNSFVSKSGLPPDFDSPLNIIQWYLLL